MIQTSDHDQDLLTNCIRQAKKLLFSSSETAVMDAQVLLADILQKPKAWVLAHPEARLDENQQVLFHKAMVDLEKGLPLPYVLGHWEFFGLDFIITPDVLIPRPETELLVEEAIQFGSNHKGWMAVDVGAGSGIIAICLAKACPGLSMVGVDRSRAALIVARHNAELHRVADRVSFFQGDLLAAVMKKFDLVLANLPYIPTSALSELPVAKQEPRLALDGGSDGLSLYRRLLSDCVRLVAPGGRIFLEIEADRGSEVETLVKETLPRSSCVIKNDLQGRQRLIIISV